MVRHYCTDQDCCECRALDREAQADLDFTLGRSGSFSSVDEFFRDLDS